MTEEIKPKPRRKPASKPVCWQRLFRICLRSLMGGLGFVMFMICVMFDIHHEELRLLGELSAALLGLVTLDRFAGGAK
jgi:hypothetical protein